MRYVYSIVRFVPDPARGEFVNVGAIVGSEESSEWEVRQIENPLRARAIDDRKSLDAVWSFLDRVGRDIDEFDRSMEMLFPVTSVELSERWLERLFVDHRNLVQLSQPIPMVAASADEALDRIFDQMVVDPAHRRYEFQKKHVALAAVREAYRKHSVKKGTNLRERVALRTANHQTRFDFAVTNGKALQLTQTWSFQVPDQDTLAEQVKAWGWTIREVRDGGGELTLIGGEEFAVDPDVDLEVVYVPPTGQQEAPALVEAKNVFAKLDVVGRPVGDADAVGQRAHDLLVRAGSVTGRLQDA